MGKGRLEAFSDGVIAIIITIMVLEMRPPRGTDAPELARLVPAFLTYLLSYVYVGIYWNNHHHLLHAARSVDGRVLWANLHLLFWLSLVPFVTAWSGQDGLSTWPVASYGTVLLMSGVAYYLLTRALVRRHGADSALARAVGRDSKGLVSMGIYALALLLAFVDPRVSVALYVAVAILWVVPDRRLEKALEP